MTDQTQRLEIATVRAEIGSNITYRFNNDEIDAGGIPTESGDIKNLKLIIKEIEDKASVSTSIYPTVASGLAATAEGGMFLVASDEGNEIYAVWRKVSGAAVDTGKRTLSSQAVEVAVDAAEASAAESAASALIAQEAQAEFENISQTLDDIQSSASADVGGTVVGFFRSAASLPGNVGDQLRGQAIQLLEYIPKSQHAAIKAGTSVYDATTKVQAAIDYAASIGASIVHDFGTIVIDCVRLKPGLRGFFGAGTIKTNNLSTASGLGILQVYGSFHSSTPGEYAGINNLYLAGLTIDAAGGDKRPVFVSSMRDSHIERLTLKNMSLGATSSAIRLNWDCTGNRIVFNTINMSVVTDSNTQTCYGIHLVANAPEFSGWGTGAIINATNKCNRNIISNNQIYFGTHGISLTGCDENIINSNYIAGSAHRNIHLIQSSKNNITVNELLEAGSCAVLMAYGSNLNNVTGNNCFSNQPSGEAGIEAYVACDGNKITLNHIRTGAHYGIYFAIDATNNIAAFNTIDCLVTKKAALAIESEWKEAPAAPFLYSRPNYGAPPLPKTTWATGSTSSNYLHDNIIRNGNAACCAIYVSQIGPTIANILNFVVGNTIEGGGFAHTFYFVEETSGRLVQQVLSKNSSGYQEISKAFATRGRAHFNSVGSNDTFNGHIFYGAPANGATPSAFLSDLISLAGYTAATNVTQFVGGKEGQRITVRLGPNVTLVHGTSTLMLKGGVNFAAGATGANVFMDFIQVGGVWFELSRNA